MYSYENNQQITILSIDLHRGETRDHQSQLQTWVFYPRKCIDRLVWRWFILPGCCTIPEVQVLKASQWITSCKWLRSAQLLNLAVDCKHVHNKATTSRERVRGRMRERARGRENKRERAREGEREEGEQRGISPLTEPPSAPKVIPSHLEEPCIKQVNTDVRTRIPPTPSHNNQQRGSLARQSAVEDWSHCGAFVCLCFSNDGGFENITQTTNERVMSLTKLASKSFLLLAYFPLNL